VYQFALHITHAGNKADWRSATNFACRQMCTLRLFGVLVSRQFIRRSAALLRLDWFGWRIVVFTDFINDLQLGSELLITPETNVIATLQHELRINSRQ